MNIPNFKGEVLDAEEVRWMYATDASIYRQMPSAVVYPKDTFDLQVLVQFARVRGHHLIPRGAGTSLAGQCVGEGIVVDVSRYMNRVLHIDRERGIAIVQPGVVRDELNRQLEGTPWIFGPNTSTSNRATIGGMVGNNSSGTTSITYGVTRDKVKRLQMVLSDARIHDIHSRHRSSLADEGVLRQMDEWLGHLSADKAKAARVVSAYPHPDLHRRSTGYALDEVIRGYTSGVLDWTKVFCGSEGTLGLFAEIELQLDRRMPEEAALVVISYQDLDTSLRHVPLLLNELKPFALELMDDKIWACVAEHPTYRHHSSLISEDAPKAMLMMELRAQDERALQSALERVVGLLPRAAYSSADVIRGDDIDHIWALRRAGLGILANLEGDGEAVACIEDAAVLPQDLSAYVQDIDALMKRHGQEVVYYAHAGAGELHIRPVLDLRSEAGRRQLEEICSEAVAIIKKHRGSLSGEHGDGRVRGAFLPVYFGEEVYHLHKELKAIADPHGLFNVGKITDVPHLLDNLSALEDTGPMGQDSWQSLAMRCTGSADCIKSRALSPGMCPTYQAIPEEIYTTRGRANLLQRAAIRPEEEQAITMRSVKSCLSCKACKTECPSSVDMAWMKSKYLSEHHPPTTWRDRAISRWTERTGLLQWAPVRWLFRSSMAKVGFHMMGWHDTMAQSFSRHAPLRMKQSCAKEDATLILLVDEFSRVLQPEVVLALQSLLESMGEKPYLWPFDSMRAAISKGDLAYAEDKLQVQWRRLVAESFDVPILTIEPSAHAVLMDEANYLVSDFDSPSSVEVRHQLTSLEGYLDQRIENIDAGRSVKWDRPLLIHGHCHSRSSGEADHWPAFFMKLGFGQVHMTAPGCCGMAGSYGYEREHFDMSRAVFDTGLGEELMLNPEAVVLAAGMSCRHQLDRFSGRSAQHPVVFLVELIG